MRKLIEKTCRPARARFSDYLDGEPVHPMARVLIHIHLVACPWCRRTMKSLKATREALGALGEPPEKK